MSDDPAFVSEPPAAGANHARPRGTWSSHPHPVFRAIRNSRDVNTPAELQPLEDVELTVSIELGRAQMPLRDVLTLTRGTVIELNRQAGDPVDVVVNGQVVARGEVVVVDERLAVRITEVLVEQ